ncbi:MAG: DNA alkylation repair protein [Odoribacter sp.]|nr:DNA alkylation repair protein [Odoribacter sp.]
MDYMILNKETEEKVKEIRRRIRRLQNWGNISSLRHLGLSPRQQVGASFVSLKTLASHYTADETVAEALWLTRQREEQIIACFLLPKKINKEKITQFMQQCISPEIAEYMGSLFVCGHPDIQEITESWSNSPDPLLQIAALCAAARHLVLHKDAPRISESSFKTLLGKEYEDKYVRLVAARYQ